MRTTPRSGWRSDVATAVAVVRSRPYLWLLGIIGFALRGGILLLALPIVVLPTQVELRLALGSSLTSTGLSDSFWMVVVGASVLTLGALLVALYALARVQVGAFEQLVAHPASDEQRAGIEPRPLTTPVRRQLEVRLFVTQALGLLALLMSAVPLVAAIGDATYAELVAPTSSDVIYVRVLNQVRELVLLVIGAVFIVELITATSARSALDRAFGLTQRGSLGTRPVRMLATAAMGWALLIGVLAASMWAIDATWHQTSLVFLSAGWSGQAEQAVALLGAAFLLSIVFCLALLCCGLVSVLRASLWSLASLR